MNNISYLPTAGRRCTDCGCKKAVPAALMRRQPEKYFFTNTEDCSNCGDRIEVDGPDLTDLLAEKLAAQGICKDCLAVDNLVTCELTVPGTTMVSRVTLCTDCIASVDEAAYVQRCS